MNETDLPIDVRTSVSLQAMNTLAIPAQASFFAELSDVQEIPKLLEFTQHKGCSLFVLGEGSNCVFASDYSGLVVHNALRGRTLLRQDDDSVTVNIAAGENWHEFVRWALESGFHGLENLALIPGTVGAAPIQNIGAYGVEVKQFIQTVRAIEIGSGELLEFSNEDCQFAYRESVFKRKLRDQLIITEVEFKLSKTFKPVDHYPSLADYLESPVTACSLFEAVCAVRSAKLPSPVDVPNVGSFFKNPIVDQSTLKTLLERFPNLVYFEVGEQIKLAAAWLIDHSGWKNKNHEGVVVHQNQALVVTNPKRRRGDTVLHYAYNIQSDIKREFGIELEIEPRIIC